MQLDWNLLSAICDDLDYTWEPMPGPHILREHFSSFLGLQKYDTAVASDRGDRLFHLAITDLRHGHFNVVQGGDYWTPLFLRPSVTVQGYLLDIDTGDLLAEERWTQKPGWVRYRNPRILAPKLLFGADPAGAELDPPMCETAAAKVLLRLKRQADGKT
ncbi:hypothetical protein [uncultured Roseibium sp.]|uniref:hypothetical protein n=1 Tax=uncultured Roseibium sp. TaxID=1936171 RepID=UPI0026080B8E|nr:hypothetical protein [uncultured Roseibium sp.]